MAEKSFFHRCVMPLCIVMIPVAISTVLYFNSARIENDTAQQFVAIVFGLLMIEGTMLGPFVIYPIMFFRGAKPSERICACLMPGLAFDVYEVYVASGVFPLAESLYYALNPTAITIFLLAFGIMGICELVCRGIVRRRGEQVKVFTPAPVAGIVVMLAGLYVALIWGNGAHFFYAYINTYLFLFGS